MNPGTNTSLTFGEGKELPIPMATVLPATEYVVNISNVLDEDTGTVGVVHVIVESARAGLDLINEIVREEDCDPKDFTLTVATKGWECVGHGDGFLCTAPKVN